MNPAKSLHDQFVLWKSEHHGGNRSVQDVRALEDPDGIEAHLRAIRDVEDIRIGLDSLDEAGIPVAMYRKYLPWWRRMAMNYPTNWGSAGNPEELYPSAIMDHLEGLASWFAVTRPPLKEAERESLRNVLLEATALLEQDESVSDLLRTYLGRLIREMQNALDDEQLAQRFDFDEAGRRLWVALFGASAQSTDEAHKDKWSDLARNLWWPSAAGALGSLPGLALAVATASGH